MVMTISKVAVVMASTSTQSTWAKYHSRGNFVEFSHFCEVGELLAQCYADL